MRGDLSHRQKQYLCRKGPYARAGHQTGGVASQLFVAVMTGERRPGETSNGMFTIARYRPATQRSGAPVLVAAGGAAVTVPALAS